jgi:hypothetical protein
MDGYADWVVAPILQNYFDEPLPSELWHYTTQAGRTRMLKSGLLWASDIRYSNDRSELSHGVGLMADRVNAKLNVHGQTEDRLF